MEGDNLLKEQLEFYYKKDIAIHIDKFDGRFYGGKILEMAGDMIILDDVVLGAIPIFFREIKILEKYKKR